MVLQARELPHKLMIVMLLFLLLQSVVCHLCSSFNAPSPQHCLALVGCPMEWGPGVIFSFSLGACAWGLMLSCLLPTSSTHPCACDCRPRAVQQHTPHPPAARRSPVTSGAGDVADVQRVQLMEEGENTP